jgi:hypothetical protein
MFMMKLPILSVAAAGALALSTVAPVSVQAASVHLTPAFGSVDAKSNVVDVKWRGHRHGHWGWGGSDALWALGAFGLGTAIGSAIARPHYGHGYGYAPYAYSPGYAYAPGAYASVDARTATSAEWARCEAEFRSLRADGTYTTYDGEQKLCPYLR